MKRRIMILCVTVAALALLGVILHTPPDAITGATKKARAETAETNQTPAEYHLYCNMGNETLSQSVALDALEKKLHGVKTGYDFNSLVLHLSMIDDDSHATEYAAQLKPLLESAGINIQTDIYNETMLISRAVAGKYDLLLVSQGLTELPELPESYVTVIPAGGAP